MDLTDEQAWLAWQCSRAAAQGAADVLRALTRAGVCPEAIEVASRVVHARAGDEEHAHAAYRAALDDDGLTVLAAE